MSIRDNLEDSAHGFATQVAAPLAGKVRDTADDVLERIGSESRHLSERVGDRVSDRLEQLPKATLKRLNLVTAASARRRTLGALAIGLVIGMVLAVVFSGEKGRERKAAIQSKLGLEDPSHAAAITGDLPK